MAESITKATEKLKIEMSGEICRRCNDEESVIAVRNEVMCRTCYLKYVKVKFLKSMDNYRVGKASRAFERKVLVPMSFGPSSIATWYLLNSQLKYQIERRGGPGFIPIFVYIDQSCIDPKVPPASHLKQLEEKLPGYTYLCIPLEDVYNYSLVVTEMSNASDEFEATVQNVQLSNAAKLQTLLSSLESRTSQLDIIQILRTRLLVEIAKRDGCTSILFGDSATRLAEKTLAETAKGRGHTIPWLISDGPTPYGIPFSRPSRELQRNELQLYVQLNSLEDLCIAAPVFDAAANLGPTAARHISIDELMGQFFIEIEEKYPNIVNNVVRTASKLSLPQIDSTENDSSGGQKTNVTDVDASCEICGLPREDFVRGWSEMQYNGSHEVEEVIEEDKVNKKDIESSRPIEDAIITRKCYACERGLRGADIISWPLRQTTT